MIVKKPLSAWPKHRVMILAKHMENGLTEAEIGAKMGISKSLVHKQINKLRATFGRQGN